MTVRELIKKLSKFDSNMEVCTQSHSDNRTAEVSDIDIQNKFNEQYEYTNVVVLS